MYRHVWMTIDNIPRPSNEPTLLPLTPENRRPSLAQIAFRDLEIIPATNALRTLLSKPELCIYCLKEHTRQQVRTEEHIIAEGLGGNLVIPHAVCGDCQQRTNEGKILGNLAAVRYKMNLKLKRRKRDLENGFRFLGPDGWQCVPLDDHPTMLTLPMFSIPGKLVNNPVGYDAFTGLYILNVDANPEKIERFGRKGFAPHIVDLLAFTKFLAKIAHSYAMAKHPSHFDPVLPRYILSEHPQDAEMPENAYEYIGGEMDPYARSQSLHELALIFCKSDQCTTMMALVKIRLFAVHGGPIYYVIVGEAKPCASFRKTGQQQISFTQ